MGNENTVIRAAERTRRVLGPLDEVCPGVEELYLDLHQNPELSLQETETAAKAASRLRCWTCGARPPSRSPPEPCGPSPCAATPAGDALLWHNGRSVMN